MNHLNKLVRESSEVKEESEDMEIPMIDLSELDGENRSRTMAILHHACEKWGYFRTTIKNHGVDPELMKKVKHFVDTHYEENLKASLYDSETAKCMENASGTAASDLDWECPFFIWHRPRSNIEDFLNLSSDLRATMDEYIAQVIKLAEKLSELVCENLGLDKDRIKTAFSGTYGPSVGTKVAKYPECPYPERVRGLREHTDAGGIIVMLQDDRVSGLEFLHDGQWVLILPSDNATICVNDGDELEVLSNRRYKSVLQPQSFKGKRAKASINEETDEQWLQWGCLG